MTAYVLTGEETDLALAMERAEEMAFAGMTSEGLPLNHIRAEALRRILLGLPVSIEGVERQVNLKGPGVRITNAYIDGALELDNACAPNGDPLPRLSLIRCYIPSMISMRAARLRRLCLKNSKITYLRANDTVIGTQLDLEGVSAALPSGGAQGYGLCRVALRGAQIEDGIEARGATLVSPPARPNYTVYQNRSHYALDLAGARIGSDVRLFPDFRAIGGINMADVEVDGSVQVHGACITREEVHAMDLEGAHIQGHLDLCGRLLESGDVVEFTVIGSLHMSHARVDNGLKMHSTRIKGDLLGQYLRVGSDVDFSGRDARKDGHNHLSSFVCDGDVTLTGAKIEGNVNLCGAHITGKLELATSTIGGDLRAHPLTHGLGALSQPFHIGGDLVLEGARILSDLNLSGAQLDASLQATGLQVTGFLSACCTRTALPRSFDCKGAIILNNAQIGLDLDMTGAVVEREIVAKNIRTGGDILMCNSEKDPEAQAHGYPFIAHRRVNVSGGIVAGDLDLNGAYLHNGMRCRGTQIKSALLVRLMDVPFVENNKPSIDLTNAHTNVLIDGRGDGKHYSNSFNLALEGLTYGRFGQHADARSALNPDNKYENALLREDAWTGRLRWLSLQYTDENDIKVLRENYRADVYNTLYRVLKNNGYSTQATDVLVRKLSIERRLQKSVLIAPLLLLYDYLFGFGLRPVKSFVVYAVYYVLVLGMVCYASWQPRAEMLPAPAFSIQHPIASARDWTVFHINAFGLALSHTALKPNVLVTQPMSQSRLQRDGTASSEKLQDFVDVYDYSGANRVREVACGARIKPALYAFDMIIPAIDFNQATKCDLSEGAGGWWSLLRAIATLLGWVVTSITVLTLSGIIRRQTEPA